MCVFGFLFFASLIPPGIWLGHSYWEAFTFFFFFFFFCIGEERERERERGGLDYRPALSIPSLEEEQLSILFSFLDWFLEKQSTLNLCLFVPISPFCFSFDVVPNQGALVDDEPIFFSQCLWTMTCMTMYVYHYLVEPFLLNLRLLLLFSYICIFAPLYSLGSRPGQGWIRLSRLGYTWAQTNNQKILQLEFENLWNWRWKEPFSRPETAFSPVTSALSGAMHAGIQAMTLFTPSQVYNPIPRSSRNPPSQDFGKRTPGMR